jgi:hypothetical protein
LSGLLVDLFLPSSKSKHKCKIVLYCIYFLHFLNLFKGGVGLDAEGNANYKTMQGNEKEKTNGKKAKYIQASVFSEVKKGVKPYLLRQVLRQWKREGQKLYRFIKCKIYYQSYNIHDILF